MRVEAGLITVEQEVYMNELYPHYVPAYRDFSYSGIGAVKGSRNLEVSKTVKKAKGGGQDISEFEQSIAEQTEQLLRAGRINQLANAIYEAATASNDDTYVEIVNEPKKNSPDIEMTEDILSQNAVKVAKMSPVAKLTGNEFSSDGKGTLQEKVVSFFDSFGNKVKTKEIGIVDVTKSSFRDDKAHGLTRNKVISFKSIPEVLSNGRVIDVYHPDGKPYERITIAAPVMIGSEKYYVGVMVQKDNQSNRMYLHDLITEKATLSFNTEPTAENGEGIRDKGHLFITSILKNALKVNSSAKNSENLGSQDDIYDAFNRDTEVQQKNKNNQITFYKDGEKITMNVSREIFLGFE